MQDYNTVVVKKCTVRSVSYNQFGFDVDIKFNFSNANKHEKPDVNYGKFFQEEGDFSAYFTLYHYDNIHNITNPKPILSNKNANENSTAKMFANKFMEKANKALDAQLNEKIKKITGSCIISIEFIFKGFPVTEEVLSDLVDESMKSLTLEIAKMEPYHANEREKNSKTRSN